MLSVGRPKTLPTQSMNEFAHLLTVVQFSDVGELLKDERTSYICTLSPLFDIQSVGPIGTTYLVSLSVSPSQASANDTFFTTTPASVVSPTLTVVTESPEFHTAMAVSRSIFLPAVTAALAFFVTR